MNYDYKLRCNTTKSTVSTGLLSYPALVDLLVDYGFTEENELQNINLISDCDILIIVKGKYEVKIIERRSY